MIASTARMTALGLATALLAGLSGCTSGMEDAARQELKANASAGVPATDPQAAAALADSALPDPTEPAPIVPGTNSPAPIPTFKAIALAAPGSALPAAEAVAVMTAQQDAKLQAPAMPDPNAQAALTTLPIAGDPVDLSSDVSEVQTIVPTPKPAGMLAYADPSAKASLSALDAQFDTSPVSEPPEIEEAPQTSGPTVINSLIKKYSALYEVPEALVHRVVKRESTYNPAAFNNGHYGLMQIKYATAKSMGYDGPANGLFEAENNLKYAVKYLRGAWLVADRNNDGAVRLYARGYYYDAKRKGMLHVLR